MSFALISPLMQILVCILGEIVPPGPAPQAWRDSLAFERAMCTSYGRCVDLGLHSVLSHVQAGVCRFLVFDRHDFAFQMRVCVRARPRRQPTHRRQRLLC